MVEGHARKERDRYRPTRGYLLWEPNYKKKYTEWKKIKTKQSKSAQKTAVKGNEMKRCERQGIQTRKEEQQREHRPKGMEGEISVYVNRRKYVLPQGLPAYTCSRPTYALTLVALFTFTLRP